MSVRTRESEGDRRGLTERLTPGLLLTVLGEHARRSLCAAYAQPGLSVRQVRVLGLLHDNGPTGQQDLVAHLEVDPSVLVALLNPLEDKGFISRDRDPANRRRHQVSLTPSGKRLLAKARRAQVEAEASLLAGLTTSERAGLTTTLTRLYEQLDIRCAADRAL